MAGSLQDQLLKAGLADAKKANKINQTKKKQAKVQRRSNDQHVDETKAQAQLARAKKVDKDRSLNQEKQARAEQKAIVAQVIQLIEVNRIDRRGAELSYNFTDSNKIKKILVDAVMLEQLSRGRLAIVSLNDRYEVVASQVAEKIKLRLPERVIVCNDAAPMEEDEDDPYADFKIPDDLMW